MGFVMAEEFTDHELYGLLKDRDDEAWRIVWQEVVLKIARIPKYAQMMRKWNLEPAELHSRLFWEMVYKGRIENYRDDGGSLFAWLGSYVRGYITREKPREGLVYAGAAIGGDDGEGETTFEENIVAGLSEQGDRNALRDVDPAMERKLAIEEAEACFAELWRESPLKAYVLLLKHRLNLSSAEIQNMLSISSRANVDQLSSRAVKDMGKLKREL